MDADAFLIREHPYSKAVTSCSFSKNEDGREREGAKSAKEDAMGNQNAETRIPESNPND